MGPLQVKSRVGRHASDPSCAYLEVCNDAGKLFLFWLHSCSLDFPGIFSAYKLSYRLELQLTDSDTYLALLSVRNPALAGSLRLTRFWLTSLDISKLSSLGETN